jgi:hypothetical protein
VNLKAELEIRHLYGELDHLVSEKICDGWPKDSKPKSSNYAGSRVTQDLMQELRIANRVRRILRQHPV